MRISSPESPTFVAKFQVKHVEHYDVVQQPTYGSTYTIPYNGLSIYPLTTAAAFFSSKNVLGQGMCHIAMFRIGAIHW